MSTRLPEWAEKAVNDLSEVRWRWPSVDLEAQVIVGIGVFDPKDDITPMEAARIGYLYAMAVGPAAGRGDDLKAFVERHGLMRHFKAV